MFQSREGVCRSFNLKQIGEKTREKYLVYVGFKDLEKAYDRLIGKFYARW